MTQTTPPAYIDRDTYVGRHSVHRKSPKAGVFLASEVAELVGPEGVIWISFGATFPGRESFGRERYVADGEGNLHVFDSNGRKVIVHPASRKLRLLTS